MANLVIKNNTTNGATSIEFNNKSNPVKIIKEDGTKKLKIDGQLLIGTDDKARATLEIISGTDSACDLYLGSNNKRKWSWSCRSESNAGEGTDGVKGSKLVLYNRLKTDNNKIDYPLIAEPNGKIIIDSTSLILSPTGKNYTMHGNVSKNKKLVSIGYDGLRWTGGDRTTAYHIDDEALLQIISKGYNPSAIIMGHAGDTNGENEALYKLGCETGGQGNINCLGIYDLIAYENLLKIKSIAEIKEDALEKKASGNGLYIADAVPKSGYSWDTVGNDTNNLQIKLQKVMHENNLKNHTTTLNEGGTYTANAKLVYSAGSKMDIYNNPNVYGNVAFNGNVYAIFNKGSRINLSTGSWMNVNGAYLDFYNGSYIKLQEGTSINFQPYAYASFKEGAYIDLYNSAYINLQSGSRIKLYGESGIAFNDSSFANFTGDSRIHFNNASYVRFLNDSALNLIDNSQINLSETSSISLNDSASINFGVGTSANFNSTTLNLDSSTLNFKVGEAIFEQSSLKVQDHSNIYFQGMSTEPESAQAIFGENSEAHFNPGSQLHVGAGAELFLDHTTVNSNGSNLNFYEDSHINLGANTSLSADWLGASFYSLSLRAYGGSIYISLPNDYYESDGLYFEITPMFLNNSRMFFENNSYAKFTNGSIVLENDSFISLADDSNARAIFGNTTFAEFKNGARAYFHPGAYATFAGIDKNNRPCVDFTDGSYIRFIGSASENDSVDENGQIIPEKLTFALFDNNSCIDFKAGSYAIFNQGSLLKIANDARIQLDANSLLNAYDTHWSLTDSYVDLVNTYTGIKDNTICSFVNGSKAIFDGTSNIALDSYAFMVLDSYAYIGLKDNARINLNEDAFINFSSGSCAKFANGAYALFGDSSYIQLNGTDSNMNFYIKNGNGGNLMRITGDGSIILNSSLYGSNLPSTGITG